MTLHNLTANRFAPASLYGKLANIEGDIDPTHLRETASFKMLAGDDSIGAEFKNKDMFTFTSYAVPLFSANEIPTTGDSSDAYFRRWVAPEFPHKLSGRFDESTLTDEAPGIAAWALRFLPDVLANGTVPNVITQEKFETRATGSGCSTPKSASRTLSRSRHAALCTPHIRRGRSRAEVRHCPTARCSRGCARWESRKSKPTTTQGVSDSSSGRSTPASRE